MARYRRVARLRIALALWALSGGYGIVGGIAARLAAGVDR